MWRKFQFGGSQLQVDVDQDFLAFSSVWPRSLHTGPGPALALVRVRGWTVPGRVWGEAPAKHGAPHAQG